MSKYLSRVLIFICLSLSRICLSGQTLPERQETLPTEKYANPNCNGIKSQNVRVVFYNTENLYDPYDDTTKLDNEFTAKGKNRWTFSKFSVKLAHLAKTMMAIGGHDLPALIGLSEIENRYVMNKIIYESPLKKLHYRFIHYESPDARGIDVALLYRPEKFKLISSLAIRIQFPFDTNLRTRDILYVRGILFQEDTLHVFVNHWPSRLGGMIESEVKRKFVASVLKEYVDSILRNNNQSNILIMGDFNDEPDQPSIKEILHSGPVHQDIHPDELVNLMYDQQKDWTHGTIKYQGKWTIIDQFIVSGSMISNETGLCTSPKDARIFQPDFLMEKETTFLGSKPLRTYAGPRYIGGFSDHLPIYLDIWKR